LVYHCGESSRPDRQSRPAWYKPLKVSLQRDKATCYYIFYMNVQGQIKEYIASQPEPKRSDMQELHQHILQILPKCKLWFLDGRDDKGKIVSNPNIGYGLHDIKYADGKSKEFYKIGLSANTTGISVYIVGIDDKTYLAKKYGKKIGKASVTGYCIKFKTLKDINIEILEEAIRYGYEEQSG
jgi:hypothetical protein